MSLQSLDRRPGELAFGSSAGFMKAVAPVLPLLRAYGRRLTGNVPDSDDLVQDTLVRAWRARERFQPGTNLKAWMIRIERNSFLNGRRRARHQVELDPEVLDRRMSETPSQEERLHLDDLDHAIDALPAAQREAFVAVSQGCRYDDLADRLGIGEGTLKSRVSRARAALVEALESPRRAPERSAKGPVKDVGRSTAYERWKRSGSRLIG